MATQYQVRVIMNCVLEEWRMRGVAVEGREASCLLGIGTVYFDTQLVSFQSNNFFPFSGRAHICLRDAGNVFLQNISTNIPNKTAPTPRGK